MVVLCLRMRKVAAIIKGLDILILLRLNWIILDNLYMKNTNMNMNMTKKMEIMMIVLHAQIPSAWIVMMEVIVKNQMKKL